MPQHPQTNYVRKTLKTAAIVLAVAGGLLLVALVVLFYLAEPLAERHLKKQVALQTDGLYRLEFNGLQLRTFSVSLTLEEPRLLPDTAVFRQQLATGRGGGSLLQVQAKEVQVAGINVLGYLLRKRLKVGRIKIEQPQITQLLVQTPASPSGNSREHGGSRSKRLRSLHIREIEIQDAAYKVLEQGERQVLRHQVAHLNLQVTNLWLDSLEQPSLLRRLKVNTVEAEARDYAFFAPDSVYALRVGQAGFSSEQHELKAENITVHANHQANRVLPAAEARRVLFRGQVQELRFTGVHAGEAFRTKQLLLNQVLIRAPALEMLKDATIPDKDDTPELQEFYTNLSPYLQVVRVEELRLNEGSFRYNRLQDTLDQVLLLHRTDLALHNLQLDSVSVFSPNEKPFASEVLATLQGFTYTPLHRLYSAKAESLELSTRGQYLQASGVRITGDWDQNRRERVSNSGQRTFYDIVLPGLHFRELDLFKALRTSRLSIGSIEVQSPAIGVRTDRHMPTAEKEFDLEAVYESMAAYLTSVQVATIRVNDASFTHHSRRQQVQRLLQLEHATLVATGLAIDSAFVYHPQQKLPLNDLVLTAQRYTYRLPDNTYTFTLGSLRYSTRLQVLTAQSIDIKSSSEANQELISAGTASRNLYDLSATHFRATGLDIIEALNKGRLAANEMVLRQPNLAILLDRNIASSAEEPDYQVGLFQIVNPITAKKLVLADGTFTFREKRQEIMVTHVLHHASATVEGLYLAPSSLTNLAEELPMQEVHLTAAGYTYRSADSLYTILLDSLHYSSRDQEMIARTFTVSSDKKVNERLKAVDLAQASHNLFDVRAQKVSIAGFDLIRAYATGHYAIKEMQLRSPEITVLQDHGVPPKGRSRQGKATEGEAPEKKGTMDQLASIVETFRLERLEVTDGAFTFHRLQDTLRTTMAVPHVDIAVDQLRLISLRAADPLDMFAVDDVGVVVRDYSITTPDSLYAISFRELKSSLHSRSLTVDSLRVRPLFSKEAYRDKLDYATDRFDIVVPTIKLQDISLRALFNRQYLIVQKVSVQQPQIEIYRDNTIGLHPERRPEALQQMLLQAGIYIRVDTVLVEGARIAHPVIGIGAKEPGVLLLEDVRLLMQNITNDSSLIRLNNFATVDASARFMDAGQMQVFFRFQLDHPENRYTFDGTLGAMDFTAVNPLFEPMMFVRVNRGMVRKLTFSVDATEHRATGRVIFHYNDLKLELLNKKAPDNPGFFLKVANVLLNNVVVKSNNPTPFGKFRNGKIKEERNYERAVFHHMAQSLLNGVTSSLMPAVVEKLVRAFVKDM